MSSTDYHFFDSLAQMESPFYDWERQIIHLPFSYKELEIADEERKGPGNGMTKFSKLVHEYIHYLQNFATAWGAPVFTDLSLAMWKIGASSVGSTELIKLPLDFDNIQNELLVEGLKLREQVRERIDRFYGEVPHPTGSLSAITASYSEEGVTLTNGRITAQLGGKAIREHMAHTGTQLFLGKTDVDIHDYNASTIGFKSGGERFSAAPYYWIMYEYFYETHLFSQLARGIFHLTQQCLVMLNPELALLRFFIWFDKKKSAISVVTPFSYLVEEWLQDGQEGYHLYAGYTKSVEHCQAILDLANKHSAHDLFLFSQRITAYALKNIQKTVGGRFLFRLTDDLQSVDFWKRKIREIGTGLIVYPDNINMYGGQTHKANMEDAFTFMASASLVVKKLVTDQIRGCPFLDDVPLCTASYKGEPRCYSNPFLIGEGRTALCLFGNGVKLTALQDRIDFSS